MLEKTKLSNWTKLILALMFLTRIIGQHWLLFSFASPSLPGYSGSCQLTLRMVRHSNNLRKKGEWRTLSVDWPGHCWKFCIELYQLIPAAKRLFHGCKMPSKDQLYLGVTKHNNALFVPLCIVREIHTALTCLSVHSTAPSSPTDVQLFFNPQLECLSVTGDPISRHFAN